MTHNKYNGQRRLIRCLLASTAMVMLAACGSSGVRTEDFQSASGSDQFRASEGFAEVTGPEGGEGVIIAIIDDGIEEDHPDIAPNLVDSMVFDGAVDVDSNHGTAVASIAAGAAGNGGTQGVAFNAGILALQAGDQDPNNPNVVVIESRIVAAALDRAVTDGADIANLSLSFGSSGTLRLDDGSILRPNPGAGAQIIGEAMEAAAANGLLMVVAAGNDGDDLDEVGESRGLDPGSVVEIGANFPGLFARDPGLSEAVIVAVAVDGGNNLASFSNTCLGVEDRCLAAPGVNVTAALTGGRTGGVGSGTSFAAPRISGAAAVVQAAFPGTSPQDAGNRLLSTATDLGTDGPDPIFGRGRLNLENALSPQGELAVATSNRLDGPREPLTESELLLGGSLALGGAGADLLAKAVALDEDNFPFTADLSGVAQIQSRATGLSSFIGSSGRRIASVASSNVQATLSLAEEPRRDDPFHASLAPSDRTLQKEAASPRLEMRSEVVDGVDVFFGLNGSSVTNVGVTKRLAAVSTLFEPTAFLAPFDQLAGEQSGGGASIALNDKTDLLLSTFVSTKADEGREASMQKIELAHRMSGGIEIRLGYGFMSEDGSFLGSRASGAFGDDSGGKSHYVDLSLVTPIAEDLSLFGAYSHGLTEASGGTGLISDMSGLRSSAFGAGLSLTDVASAGDGLTFMIGQPLRVGEGSAEVTVPIGRTSDGRVIQESADLDLTPSGREIAFEATYDFGLDDEQSLATGVFLRLNPDHDPDAKPDAGIGLKYILAF